MTEPRTYSINVRVRRVTTEEGYVSVPVTDAVMADAPEPDGKFHLDGKKVFAEAVKMGAVLDSWTVEDQSVIVHPVQKARPGYDK
jgi:hypothetical protein